MDLFLTENDKLLDLFGLCVPESGRNHTFFHILYFCFMFLPNDRSCLKRVLRRAV